MPKKSKSIFTCLPNTSPKEFERIKFNWGYWDGRADKITGRFSEVTYHRSTHLFTVSRENDISYYEGYIRGRDTAGEASESSTPQWEAYQADN